MILIENLKVKHGSQLILDHVNLSLETGKVYGLLGLNGSGKTTFFNSLYGFLKPEEGSITLNGNKLSKKETGYLETENFFYPNITGEEYLSLFTQKSKTFNLEKWKELFALPMEKTVDEYSSGMKKKLALLGLLKMDKSLYLLDEPFNGVDIETNRIFEIVFKEMAKKGKTLIITSHILETMVNTSDRILFLENHKIARIFEPGEYSLINNLIFKKLEEETRKIISETL
jgi:ABC-2 type transport system ATP-binding protein